MILNKNRMIELLSPEGKARAQEGVRKLTADLHRFFRDQGLTGMTDDMIDAVIGTGSIIGACYNVMFEVEMECRLHMGTTVDDALNDTVNLLMSRGSDIMAEQMARMEHYQSLKEQLERNKHGG